MKKKLLPIVFSFALVFNLTACNAQTVQAYVNLADNIAIQMAILAGAPQGTADKVAADLALANKLYGDLSGAVSSAKPGIISQIDAALTAAETDIDGILSLASIKDPQTIADIKAGLALAIVAVEGIYTIANANKVPVPVTAARVSVRAAVPSVLLPKSKAMTPAQIKNLYNTRMAVHPGVHVS